MLHGIVVHLDSLDQWQAAYADTPHLSSSGDSPSAALWGLLNGRSDRFVNPRTIVATDPESMTRLNFATKPESKYRLNFTVESANCGQDP